MPQLPRRFGTARHIAVMVVLMLLTLAAFGVEDLALRRALRFDADLATLERGKREVVAAMTAGDVERAALAERWTALRGEARDLVVRLHDAEAGLALSRAALAINSGLVGARGDGTPPAELATAAEAALDDMMNILRRRLDAEQARRLGWHRAITALIVALLAIEALWLMLPSLRRVVRAERDAEEAQERLAYLAHHDDLTGLGNRRALEEHLARLTAEPTARIGLILCDLDGFKPINDVYGHEAGDTVLEAVARRLEHGLRPGDVAARLGGDEFVLVVADATDGGTLTTIAERIRHQLADPVGYGAHHLRFSASLGTALFPDDGATPHALLNAADAAMYEAKQAGGMGVRAYTNRLRERDEMRHAIVHELEAALENGGLSLVFQPQVALASGAHVGFEVLTRWPSRTRGHVPPDMFIPIAESTGLLVPLTRWLMGEIARLTAAWRRAGLEPVTVSINVSGGALVRDDLLADLARAAAGDEPGDGRLGIEITEDAMFGRNAEAVLERLRLLHDRGMPIAIDDFGTGYASLSHLGRIPFDRLKIAGGFIHQLETNANAAAVVRTIVELAQRMGGRAVATCVETDAQRRFLERHGCDEAQGFGVCAPLSPSAAATYLERVSRPQAARSAPR